jgi:hypothetical protein
MRRIGRRAGLPGSWTAYHGVLAVKDEREKHSPPFSRSSILDSCARRDSRGAGNPAQDKFEESHHE